ncbi:alpha/beta-type small acid-soluble spore protein [Paenibacillus oryzisoli]|uniref:Alpha/beta hydrolase n=1 Tax=Paenibacillus oryzisoli TaxID=1850517 RepID=A0A198A7T9_9BACL|nr:alpha/beta-type small acid-soluble spore protein [Paenibacillus oryzisoli]OAS17136.1 alpha/beta hydrolase [Paenibacillus oryzisoli]
MSRRRRNRAMVPGSEQGLALLKAHVMQNQGYDVNPQQPDLVKYEVARTLGVPLQQGYNGHLSSEDAGRVGGPIGGAMVKELVRMAQQQLANKRPPQP